MLALAIFGAIGSSFCGGFALDLGSASKPLPKTTEFLFYWLFLGSFATVCLAFGFSQIEPPPALGPKLRAVTDRTWIWAGAIGGFAIPALIRQFLLVRMPLTDDESAYLFMARLLATGRISVHSPPLKLFFDRAFMVNDGRFYAGYFLGWPLLLAPGARLGIPGLMNPLYAALTVPPLYRVLQRLAGRRCARLGLILYLTSPLLMIAAATELSYLTSFGALVWCTWAALKPFRFEPRRRDGALVALFFSVAFFIRPFEAVGCGLPVLAFFVLRVRRSTPGFASPAVLGFVAVGFSMAAVFLAINAIQTGHPFLTPYRAYLDYAKSNGGRFSLWTVVPSIAVPNLRFSDPTMRLAVLGLGVVRLNAMAFSLPFSVGLAALAVRSKGLWLPLSMLASFALTHSLLESPGIDTFGPVHLLEGGWPLLILMAMALNRMDRWRVGVCLSPAVALVAAGLLASASSFLPLRLAPVALLARSIQLPFELVEKEARRPAVIFVPPFEFAPACLGGDSNHFVHFPPVNDPDLRAPILWVNDLGTAEDAKLLEEFPGRSGYVIDRRHGSCVGRLAELPVGPGNSP